MVLMKKEYIKLSSRVIELHGSETFMQAMSSAETGSMGVDTGVGKDASEALVRGQNMMMY